MSFLSADLTTFPRQNIPPQYRTHAVAFTPKLPVTQSEWTLQSPILFQVVGIRDISRSNIDYIDTITEILDRLTKSQLVREVDVEAEESAEPTAISAKASTRALYKLTLQDCTGSLCFAYEKQPLPFLRGTELYPIKLGSKLVAKSGTAVMFNSLQLTPATTQFLGGEIDRLNYQLYKRELRRLKEEIHYQG